MRRVALAGAVIGLAILGTGAFVLTRGGEEPVHAPAPARAPVAQAPQGQPTPQVPMAGRIAISPAQLREASAAGLVDRPIRSILDVRGPMHYGDFVWNDKGVP